MLLLTSTSHLTAAAPDHAEVKLKFYRDLAFELRYYTYSELKVSQTVKVAKNLFFNDQISSHTCYSQSSCHVWLAVSCIGEYTNLDCNRMKTPGKRPFNSVIGTSLDRSSLRSAIASNKQFCCHYSSSSKLCYTNYNMDTVANSDHREKALHKIYHSIRRAGLCLPSECHDPLCAPSDSGNSLANQQSCYHWTLRVIHSCSNVGGPQLYPVKMEASFSNTTTT